MTKEAEETRVKPLPDPPAADKTDKAEKPSERELALEYYKVARAEIIERMKMREAILFAYLTAVSALLTVVLASTRQRSCFCSCHCLVPLLGLGTASIIAQHHEMIGSGRNIKSSSCQRFSRVPLCGSLAMLYGSTENRV
jgi:hypothetical protein